MKKLLTVSGIIGAVILFVRGVWNWLNGFVEWPEDIKKIMEDKEGRKAIKPDIIKVCLKAIFCWPYYVFIGVTGLIKSWKKIKNDDNIKKSVNEYMKTVSEGVKKDEDSEEKTEEETTEE